MIMALLWKTNCLFTAFDTRADLGGGYRGCGGGGGGGGGAGGGGGVRGGPPPPPPPPLR